MVPPCLDFTSDLFDAHKALHSSRVRLPYPKVKTYNNIAEYYSHNFLKKKLESVKSSKDTEKPCERNYEWYYDTLGLSEYQRSFSRCTKKKKHRKGKKPVSVFTIPGSPLRSQKVSVVQSDFKDYCLRKYRSLNTKFSTIDTKSIECSTFPSNSISELSTVTKPEPFEYQTLHSNSVSEQLSMSSVKSQEPVHLLTSSQSIKLDVSKVLSASGKINCPLSYHTIKSEPPELSATSHITTKLPAASCGLKAELSDSSNDSFTDEELIFKMKSNLQKVHKWKNANEAPFLFQRKNEHLELSSKRQQATNRENLGRFSKTDLSFNKQTLNSYSGMKTIDAVNNSKKEHSPQLKDTSAAISKQKKGSKKQKICSNDELKLQKDLKTRKHKKKQGHEKNKDAPANDLVGGQPQKCALYKENNSVNDTNLQSNKKRKKSALKSHENVLDCKKITNSIEADSKTNNVVSNIKTENTPVNNQCTCNFPCGLSHLCTCGYFASAKEVLSKFKIPRKKK